MIPIRLSLRNFMCYREQTETLDLTGVHLACLSGENGAGKSALLEAITWVLWGKARERTIDDELISKGASEMEVDFEFLLNGDSYRVIRKRSTKGKTGSTMLDIQVLDPGSANPRTLTGATIRESQERIIGLLKLDYETFTNSAFIMQGRADQFTVKSPTERKKVLAEILGLEQYDRLEEEAKSRARDRAAAVGMKKAEIERIDRDLLHRPDYVRRLEEVEDELTVKQAGLAEIRGELTRIRTHEQRLEHTRDRLIEIANRIQHRERGMDVVKTRIVRNDEKRKSLESLVLRRADIESGWAGLQTLQERNDRLNGVRTDLDRLTIQSTKLDGTLSEERIRLDSLAQRHADSIRRYQQNLAGRGVLDQQLAEVLSKLNKLALMQQQHEDTRCEKEAQEVRLRTLRNERDTLEKEGKSLRQKLDLLVEAHAQGGNHVGCPLCGTGLTEDALRRVRESYERDIDEKRRNFREKDRQLEEVKAKLVALDKQMAREQEELKPLDMQRRREAELKSKQAGLDRDEQELAQEESALVVVRMRLNDGDYGHDARKQLETVRTTIGLLEYDQDEHSDVRKKLAELRSGGYESQYHSLQSATKEMPGVQQAIDEDNVELVRLRAEQEADRAEELALTPQKDELEEVRNSRIVKEREAETLDKAVSHFLGERGQLKSKIAHCDMLQEEKETHTGQLAIAAEEKAIYDELTTAFGKKGIQAMIIENVIPEVEEEANSILHNMTDGRMTVQFKTQRDAKSGKGNVIETLDIEIADEVGTRAYEMYSGGEAFRVNFAVRIALSKLLARRAGTQLQTLVIDEGFGSQDGQGREKLIGAIRSIQDHFEKILVITHIEELKDEFPTRINIVKTANGSRIMMSEMAEQAA